jgi:tRNA A37 threonylcarbamoyladenosine dehydratase
VCGTRPLQDESMRLGCEGGLGAATHVTAAFGCVAVGHALEVLLKSRPSVGV